MTHLPHLVGTSPPPDVSVSALSSGVQVQHSMSATLREARVIFGLGLSRLGLRIEDSTQTYIPQILEPPTFLYSGICSAAVALCLGLAATGVNMSVRPNAMSAYKEY